MQYCLACLAHRACKQAIIRTGPAAQNQPGCAVHERSHAHSPLLPSCCDAIILSAASANAPSASLPCLLTSLLSYTSSQPPVTINKCSSAALVCPPACLPMCVPARELAIQLRRDVKPALDAQGIKLYLVSIGTYERSKEFVQVTGSEVSYIWVQDGCTPQLLKLNHNGQLSDHTWACLLPGRHDDTYVRTSPVLPTRRFTWSAFVHVCLTQLHGAHAHQ